MTKEGLEIFRLTLRLGIVERIALKVAVIQGVAAGATVDQAVDTAISSLAVDDQLILGLGKGLPPEYVAVYDQEVREAVEKMTSILNHFRTGFLAAAKKRSGG